MPSVSGLQEENVSTDLQQLTEAIIKGNRKEAVRLTQEAIDAGADPKTTLDAMVAGMDEVGKRFQANEVFVPEMLIAARAMKESIALLEPLLVAAGIKPELTAVIGTVQGDLHDIGKNLVAMMWKGANFEVIDLGTNVPADKFVAAAKEHHANVIGLSALLTTTMPAMKTTVDALKAAGLTDVKVLIGGAPITQQFADEIGADGYAADAASAVDKVRQLIAA
jgi:5-methyltetrahydrofolate--homocysteine methyltransferase